MTVAQTDTYRGATFVSADSHVTEPIELYAERVDAEFHDRAPRIESSDGWRTFFAEGMDPRKLMSEQQLQGAVIGDFDIDLRMREQARDGVSAEVIFPTFALQACFAPDDAELQIQLCRAYNSWAHDAFAGHDNMIAVGAVPLLNIDDGIAEARRLAAAGFAA